MGTFMSRRSDPRSEAKREVLTGILTRLLRNKAGNALTIMAAGIIPLAALVGGAVDMSRLYLAKTRLQQACDAGALAGRKVMGGGQWSANNGAANTAALQFFDANFKDGSYGTNGRTRAFSESAGKVTGTASVTVPMTIMRVFRQTSRTLTVACDAEMRIPNTDVMFVLDTTGSMAQAIPGDTTVKIDGLKKAVKCFYEILQKLDTNADCGSTPSGGISNQVQVRFGFMPFSTNVNVGKLLPTSYFADSWSYDTRQAEYQLVNVPDTYNTGTPTVTNNNYNYTGSWTPWSTVSSTSGQCNQPNPASTITGTEGDPYNQQTSQSGNNQIVTWKTDQSGTVTQYQYVQTTSGPWWAPTYTCTLQQRTRPGTLTRTYSRTDTPATWKQVQQFYRWHYGLLPQNISGLKNGTSWNSSFSLPIGNNGAQQSITWDGCIEERQTTKASSYDPIPSAAKDLNIDMVPNQADSTTLWAPALDELVYMRGKTSAWSGSLNMSDLYDTNNYVTATNYGGYYCPTEAKKLQSWTDPAAFDAYVDGLTPSGNTYHDIGLLWGARFISPTGIFASENAFTPLGGEIQRHIIFMTDGEVCTSTTNYQAYGVAWFDRRETDSAQVPTDGCSTDAGGGGTMSAQVIARYTALCTAVKNKNITLWVVYFGSPAADDVTRMTACASEGRFYQASSSAQLLTTFSSIAAQISQLRLTS